MNVFLRYGKKFVLKIRGNGLEIILVIWMILLCIIELKTYTFVGPVMHAFMFTGGVILSSCVHKWAASRNPR